MAIFQFIVSAGSLDAGTFSYLVCIFESWAHLTFIFSLSELDALCCRIIL